MKYFLRSVAGRVFVRLGLLLVLAALAKIGLGL